MSVAWASDGQGGLFVADTGFIKVNQTHGVMSEQGRSHDSPLTTLPIAPGVAKRGVPRLQRAELGPLVPDGR